MYRAVSRCIALYRAVSRCMPRPARVAWPCPWGHEAKGAWRLASVAIGYWQYERGERRGVPSAVLQPHHTCIQHRAGNIAELAAGPAAIGTRARRPSRWSGQPADGLETRRPSRLRPRQRDATQSRHVASRASWRRARAARSPAQLRQPAQDPARPEQFRPLSFEREPGRVLRPYQRLSRESDFFPPRPMSDRCCN